MHLTMCRRVPAITVLTALIVLPVVGAQKNEFSRSRTKHVEPTPAGGGVAGMCGDVFLTQSLDQTITPLNSVACSAGGLHTDNSYMRAFDLEAEFGITEDFDICEVQFGIEVAMAGPNEGGVQPVTVNLYTASPPPPPLLFANLTPIGSASFNVPDQAETIFSAPVTGTAPAGSTLVVEIFTPDGQTVGNQFFIGSNDLGETGPSYIAAAGCGLPEPLPTSDIGFGNVNYVLNVIGGGPPDGDTCAACIPVGDGDFSGTTTDNTGCGITDCGFQNTIDEWLCYTASCTGTVTASTCNAATFDTVLSVFDGCPEAGDPPIACNDDSTGCGLTTELSWSALAGQVYLVRVSGFNGEDGDYTITFSCDAAPTGACCQLDGTCDDTVAEADCTTGGGTYQGDGSACANVICPAPLGACCESNACTEITEAECDAGGGTWFGPLSVCLGDSNGDNADDLCLAPALPNDECEGRLDVFDGSTPIDLTEATDSGPLEPSCGFPFGDGDIHNDIWFNYVATCTGTLFVDTCGAGNIDTRLAVYAGCECPVTAEPLECNDDHGSAAEGDTGLPCPGTFEASLSLPAVQGECYKIRVGTFSAGTVTGPDVLNIQCLEGEPTGACCFSDDTCLILTPSDCQGQAGDYQGDFSLCDPNPCLVPVCGDPKTGDCCQANGTPFCNDSACCKVVCAADSFCCDTSWDSICAGEAADLCVLCAAPTGACCLSDNTCIITDEVACKGQGGVYQGDDTTCDPSPCGPVIACGEPSTGDCCENNGTPFCSDLECCEAVCAADPFCCETTWDGVCADEAADLCTLCARPTGACCLPDTSCTEDVTQEACESDLSGTYLGDNSVCGAFQACCFGDGSCTLLAPNCCTLAGGDFQGEGSTCSPNPCNNDDCIGSMEVGEGATPFDNTNATTDGPDDCEPFFDDLWFDYVATCNGQTTFGLCNSSFDTKIAVYEGCGCDPLGAQLACSDDDCGLQSQVTIDVIAGGCYKVRVGAFGSGGGGPGELLITQDADPESGTPELSLVVDPGEGFEVGERIEITVHLDAACTLPVAGWQGFLEYDPDALNFNDVTYTAAPFALHIIDSGSDLLNPEPGIINLSAGIDQNEGQDAVNGSYLLATLNFTAKQAGCIPNVTFRDEGANPPNPPSRLTDVGARRSPPIWWGCRSRSARATPTGTERST